MYKKVFIIAEIGMNHDGSVGQAKAFIDEAYECGVDAVKFQTHIFDAESLPDAPAPKYFTSENRKDFFKRTAFSSVQWAELKNYTESKGLTFISSPFSTEAVDLLEEINVSMYKIPSGEVTNLPYLEVVAKTGKPIFLSTGMSDWGEIDRAVETITKFNTNLSVLQCTSSYPCSEEEVGLNVIKEIKSRYKIPTGLSDHTLTPYASFAAVVLGAEIIERHFTLSKKLYGPDAQFSLDPTEMKSMVEGIRAIERMLANNIDKNDISRFKNMKYTFEKSIVSKTFIPKGTVLTKELLSFKKPGDGIRADRINEVLGRPVRVDIPENSKILEEYIGER